MRLFKNKVGRPTKEMLRKRKIIVASLVVLVVALAGLGTYFGISFFYKKIINSNVMNAEPGSNGLPKIQITATNLKTNKTIKDNGNSTWTNKNVWLSGWRNYSVRFNVKASTSSGKIKSIHITWNNGGYKTTSSAEANLNSMKSKNKKTTYNSTSYIDAKADGLRYAYITATTTKGKTRTVQVRVAIDQTVPKASIAWGEYKNASGGKRYIGATGKTTCADSMSGVKETIAYEALNPNNRITGVSSVTIALRKPGTNYFVSYCYDKAGNKSKVRNATKYTYVNPVEVASVDGNPTKWTNKHVTLRVAANSKAYFLHTYAYSFDNGKTWQASNIKTFTKNQTVKIKVRDLKGNISATKEVKITKIDTTAPTVKLSWENLKTINGKYYIGSVGKVTCEDSGSGVIDAVAYEKLQENNKKNGKTSASITITRTGNNYFSGSCTDKAGNTSKVKKSDTYYYNSTNMGIQLLLVANKELGNKGTKYWKFYGAESDWCTMFVYWVTAHTNVSGVSNSCINKPGTNDCVYSNYIKLKPPLVYEYVEWMVNKNKFYHSQYYFNKYNKTYGYDKQVYKPASGDLIFLVREHEYHGNPKDCYGEPYHVGIVKEVKNGQVYYIDGNSGNDDFRYSAVKLSHAAIGSNIIMGYGHWK